MNMKINTLTIFFRMLSQCNNEEREEIKESLETLSFLNLAEALYLSLASAFEIGNHKKNITRVKRALEVPALVFITH